VLILIVFLEGSSENEFRAGMGGSAGLRCGLLPLDVSSSSWDGFDDVCCDGTSLITGEIA